MSVAVTVAVTVAVIVAVAVAVPALCTQDVAVAVHGDMYKVQ